MLLYTLTLIQGNLERKVSHVDQTTFMSDAFSDEVEGQLTLDSAHRAIEGHSFVLVLVTRISFNDEVTDGKIKFLVDRVKGGTAFVHANGDSVYDTWARIMPDGDAFRITIAIPKEDNDVQKATIHVAPEMERAVHDFIARQDRVS